MSIIDTAKALLKKGIAMGDQELINLANELLEPVSDSGLSQQEPKRSDENFIAPAKNEDSSSPSTGRRAKSEPISKNRTNKFVDGGIDCKSVEDETPEYVPTIRERKAFKTTVMKCARCDKNFDVHPVHARENYICNSCVRK
jgi:hypothetical protein